MMVRFSTRLKREDGAAAVEFALIVGVLAMLLFGMLQFGLAFFSLQNLRAASREGARVAAVGADVVAVKQRVSDASVGALPPGSAAVVVEYTSNGTTWASVAAGRACPVKASQTVNSSVRTRINLASSALPAALQDIFVVDIPLIPSIDLRGAPISGQFRCEGN